MFLLSTDYVNNQNIIIGVGTGGGGGGGRGDPAPPMYKSGGPGPPNVGAIKGSLTVKMDFFIHIRAVFAKIFLAQAQILTSKISIVLYTHKKKQACAHICIHVYVTEKIRPPQYQTSSYSTDHYYTL